MEKNQIDEILNSLFDIKEKNGEKVVVFKTSKKKDAKLDRKRKPKSDLPNS